MSELHANLENRLAETIRPYDRLLTAYSGGIDSTLIAAMARRVLGRENAPAAIGDSASLPRAELEQARALAQQLDLDLIETQPDEQDDPAYQANEADRCYHCKTHLYATLRRVADERGIGLIANGANRDDLGDYRPGMRAAEEAGVVSPLVEAGFDKAQVRLLAEQLGLPNSDKPASACLASRIPYGTPVTLQRLSRVEQAEGVLRDLGFTGFRVRHHETVARLEIPWDQVHRLTDEGLRNEIIRRVKAVGYTYVALDLEGFRSGSGNAILGEDVQK